MKLQKNSYLRLASAAKLSTLFLILSVTCPIGINAAVKETQSVGQEDINKAITPVSSAQSKKDDKKNTANDPASLGKLLYENHCLSCHESLVHIRGAHKAKTFEDVQYWVGRWALELDVKWSADEIDAVVQHLNDTYYHY
jgi:cytochrome c5